MTRSSLYEYCLASNKQILITQWDTESNGDLTIHDVTKASNKYVWWRCERGHKWKAQIKSRTRGSGCPYCSNRKIKIGENDLATTHPRLAEQWNDERNENLSPVSVSAGSAQKVWWKCEKGHEWKAAIMSRSHGAGCPVCAGKIVIVGDNDLATAYPDIAAEWHPTLNGTLTPENVTPYSNRSVWWVCELGHEYLAAVGHRTQTRSGCPYCTGRKVLPGFNDLATKEPMLCREWAQDLNGTLTPQMVTVASHKKVWWRCFDGHVWKAVVSSRTGARRHGCPECAGRVKRNYT